LKAGSADGAAYAGTSFSSASTLGSGVGETGENSKLEDFNAARVAIVFLLLLLLGLFFFFFCEKKKEK